jgi:TfoX/Sxy family transcriptional regulator of competence genes
MPYDEAFAQRLRTSLAGRPVVEKKMIGGIGFMLNGNAIGGIFRNDLMLHVPKENMTELLKRAGAKPFVMRGKVLKGWMLVDAASVKTKAALDTWLKVALAYVETLPAK